jgi:hypothetical protein
MSDASFEKFANDILRSQLHLVVGSTPESIRDEILKSGITGNKEQAQVFAMGCLVAAASVKKAIEAFLSDPKMTLARQAIVQVANLNGATNMSVLVLAGHCFLTSGFINGVTFVQEFRKRLGQNNIWEGDLNAGSTSEKRKTILRQHKSKATAVIAKAFGSGFFKLAGLDPTPMTDNEKKFWRVNTSQTAQHVRSQSGSPPRPATPSGSRKVPAASPSTASVSPASRSVAAITVPVAGSTQSSYTVPTDIQEYASTVLKQTDEQIIAEVRTRGIEAFERDYRRLIRKDVDKQGFSASTVGK